jgi:aminoglycoside 3-N-acetyltransferase
MRGAVVRFASIVPRMATAEAELRGGIEALGLSGSAVCVHSSLRTLGPVAGGADAVIDAFLAEGCTLVVPAFTYSAMAPPPVDDRPERNGTDYAPRDYGDDVFDPAGSLVSEHHMGALPAAVVRRPGRARGDHPICSFAAVGPHAELLVAGQSAQEVFAPLLAVAATGGAVLLLGVEVTAFTLLHLAELRAGRGPFRRWGRRARSGVVACATGGCSLGFAGLEPALTGLVRETAVGSSRWRAYPAAATLEAAAAWIVAEPESTRCADPSCLRCADAIAGGPLVA